MPDHIERAWTTFRSADVLAVNSLTMAMAYTQAAYVSNLESLLVHENVQMDAPVTTFIANLHQLTGHMGTALEHYKLGNPNPFAPYRVNEFFSVLAYSEMVMADMGWLQPELQMTMRSVSVRGSFDFSFEGVGEAITATRESLGATGRESRKEALRNTRQMNMIMEFEARTEATANRVRETIAVYRELMEAGVISKAEMIEGIRTSLAAQDAAAELLAASGIAPAPKEIRAD